MFESSHGHGRSRYGAEIGSRRQHESFYGTAAAVTGKHISGVTAASEVSSQLASQEWQRAGLEGKFPPELINLIGQLTASIGSHFDQVIDFLAEAISAESLRQKFGTPQVPGALAVAIRLTTLTEQAFNETQAIATKAEKEINWLKAEIQKTILVWLLAEEARHQAVMANLEKTELEVMSLNATTTQAAAETISVKNLLKNRKTEVSRLIQVAKDQVTKFFNQAFGSQTLKTAEVMVFSAQTQMATLPALDFGQAIPLNKT